MGAILSNREAEALILEVRTARTVASEAIPPAPGAFLLFPTSVVVDRAGGGQLVFPTHTSLEPGTLCLQDGTATLTAYVDGVEVSGSFSWALGAAPDSVRPNRAQYRFRQGGQDVSPPPWATQLPSSCRLWPDVGASVIRQRAGLLHRGYRAESGLLRQSERVFRKYCRGPVRRALAGRASVDEDDVVQRGILTVTRLLPLYASPRRPPSSWVRMLRFDGLRDLHREITRLDWRGEELSSLSAIRPWDPLLAVPDPSLDAAEGQAGAAAGEIAEWLGYGPALVILARLGDAGAIREVSDRLVATIGRPGETRRATRRRCRDEFRSTGRLLTASLDRALAGSVGLESRPPGR